MKIFTIDEQNNITWFASPEEATTASTTPFDTFSNKKEFSNLASVWPMERLIAIWNSLPGVAPVKRFTSAKAAVNKIWHRIEELGHPEKPKSQGKAAVAKAGAKGAPARRHAARKDGPDKGTSKARKSMKAKDEAGLREGRKFGCVTA